MSDAHYGEAIELIRHGSHHDGVSLSYFQCRDLLHVIEEGQVEILSLTDQSHMNTATVQKLRHLLKESEDGVIEMGRELDRLEKVETLCGYLLDRNDEIDVFIEDHGLEDEADAYHKVGGWGNPEANVMAAALVASDVVVQ